MRRPLIAAHRGVFAGNIPCNTTAAYEAALAQGADIMEIDVSRSADGVLFVFHPGQESYRLQSPKLISEMTAEEVRRLRYYNCDMTLTSYPVNTLDEVLEQLKGRCLINIDKFPKNMAAVAQAVRRHGMAEQVIVKTNAGEEWFRQVAEVAPDLPYMVFARGEDGFSESLSRRMPNYRGTEIIFPEESCQVAQHEYVQRMHSLGLKVWANAIVYDYQRVLSAGHNDDVSVAGRPDDGWGWLMALDVDMIQTDWPGMLRAYMDRREAACGKEA